MEDSAHKLWRGATSNSRGRSRGRGGSSTKDATAAPLLNEEEQSSLLRGDVSTCSSGTMEGWLLNGGGATSKKSSGTSKPKNKTRGRESKISSKIRHFASLSPIRTESPVPVVLESRQGDSSSEEGGTAASTAPSQQETALTEDSTRTSKTISATPIPASHVNIILAVFGRDADLYRDVFQMDEPDNNHSALLRTAYFRRGRKVLQQTPSPVSTVHASRSTAVTAKERFQAVTKAYEILNNPSWRAYYEQHGLVVEDDDDLVGAGSTAQLSTNISVMSITSDDNTEITKSYRPILKKKPRSRSLGPSDDRSIRSLRRLTWNEEVEELVYEPDLHDSAAEDVSTVANGKKKKKKKKAKAKIVIENSPEELLDPKYEHDIFDELEASLDGLGAKMGGLMKKLTNGQGDNNTKEEEDATTPVNSEQSTLERSNLDKAALAKETPKLQISQTTVHTESDQTDDGTPSYEPLGEQDAEPAVQLDDENKSISKSNKQPLEETGTQQVVEHKKKTVMDLAAELNKPAPKIKTKALSQRRERHKAVPEHSNVTETSTVKSEPATSKSNQVDANALSNRRERHKVAQQKAKEGGGADLSGKKKALPVVAKLSEKERTKPSASTLSAEKEATNANTMDESRMPSTTPKQKAKMKQDASPSAVDDFDPFDLNESIEISVSAFEDDGFRDAAEVTCKEDNGRISSPTWPESEMVDFPAENKFGFSVRVRPASTPPRYSTHSDPFRDYTIPDDYSILASVASNESGDKTKSSFWRAIRPFPFGPDGTAVESANVLKAASFDTALNRSTEIDKKVELSGKQAEDTTQDFKVAMNSQQGTKGRSSMGATRASAFSYSSSQVARQLQEIFEDVTKQAEGVAKHAEGVARQAEQSLRALSPTISVPFTEPARTASSPDPTNSGTRGVVGGGGGESGVSGGATTVAAEDAERREESLISVLNDYMQTLAKDVGNLGSYFNENVVQPNRGIAQTFSIQDNEMEGMLQVLESELNTNVDDERDGIEKSFTL